MCGIVGYFGDLKATDVILNGLKKLEYRGYDSCGICYHNLNTDRFVTYKDKGRVKHLKHDFDYNGDNHFGIGHTRWATHGAPNHINSHPHSSQSGRFVIVHNGVIENYKELVAKYLSAVYFTSETDTEVIANLIEYFAVSYPVELAIRKALAMLEGSYALLIIDKLNPNIIYAGKNKSPLLLGLRNDGVCLASDLMAFVGVSSEYYVIEDKTFVKAEKVDNEYRFSMYDPIGIEFTPIRHEVSLNDDEINRGGYDHYMLKEICEQPSVIRKIMTNYIKDNRFHIKQDVLDLFANKKRIYILAAGTSMHAGFVGKINFETLTKIPTEVFIASEFAYNKPLLEKEAAFILISQSGETADLRACLVDINKMGYPSLTITNVKTSTLAREATNYLLIHAGPEIAVASTKAYVGQIAVLAILAYVLADNPKIDMIKEMSRLAVAMEAIIDKKEYIHDLVQSHLIKRNCFYIGRGIDYYTSLEAALKLKEISYIQTEGFAAGELKHGTIALIEEDVPVIAIITQRHINKNTRSNIQEVKSRGADVLVISTNDTSEPEDDIILMDVHDLLSPALAVIPTQLIAYYKALDMGKDIDKPRNLAKSVTVE
ncbi:MAG: glutamine--fructose-6-phosphate transaminase (isomerizing) [Bacilli bacterium]|nr:glutamine--fructose-6-phosphate transaminase (isomerizing) [Bacilli bacterium]MBN2877377.1 glutamine--fructose-6-phosphate transaminase (isomerizing) [Bacilli bacterium]